MSINDIVVCELPNGLANVSKGRDIISVRETADAINCSTQTIRKHLSKAGNFYGLKPIRIGNRLNFSVRDLSRLITGDKS